LRIVYYGILIAILIIELHILIRVAMKKNRNVLSHQCLVSSPYILYLLWSSKKIKWWRTYKTL